MNQKLLVFITLISFCSFEVVQNLLDNVIVRAQIQPSEQGNTVEIIDSEGGALAFALGDGGSLAYISSEVVKSGTKIKMYASSTPAKSYPTDENFKNVYDPSQVTYLGSQTILEIPFPALNLEEEQKTFFYMSPYYDRKLVDENTLLTAEIRITLADGSEYFYPDYYVYGEEIEIRNTTLELAFNGVYPETLKISVQVVTLKE